MDICSNQLPYSWNGIRCDSAGTYVVALTNAAGCDSIATLNLTLSDPDNEGVRLLPNPASDFVDILFQQSNSCASPVFEELRLYNALGQMLKYERLRLANPPYRIRWPIGHLPAGTYFLKTGTRTLKLVVVRR